MNMSYCRFENTLKDLNDCKDALDNNEPLSERETRAKEQLLELCRELVETYGE